MGENNNLVIQQEISQNMSVASQQPFAMTNEEMAFNAMMANNRNNRKRNKDDKMEQQRNTQAWINQTQPNNMLVVGNSGSETSGNQLRGGNQRMHSVNREALQMVHQNNRASSEDLETLRENFRNSQETLKRRSGETLTIEEASLRDLSNSSESKGMPNRQHSMPNMTNKSEHPLGSMEDKRNKSTNSLSSWTKTKASSEVLTIKETHESVASEENTPNSNENAKTVKKSNFTDNNSSNRSENLNPVSPRSTSERNRQGKDVTTTADNQRKSTENVSELEPLVSPRDNIYKRTSRDSMESLTESTYDLSRSYRSLSLKDPHTAAIDLSNNCRKFFFSHMKNAEAIKNSVRAAKHERAKDKMAGKKPSSLDDAFDRLRSEMADLMDQDLSLMSQLLKLNDKIEEVKSQVAYRTRPEAYDSSQSTFETSDSEFEENDESRLDLSRSTSDFKLQGTRDKQEPEEPKKEIVLQRLSSADSRIIVYNKKSHRKKRRRRTRSRVGTDDESSEDATHGDEDSGSETDTESTLSDYSGTTIGSNHSGGEERNNVDSGIQSPKERDKPPEVRKPVVGGVSQNRKFLKFLKNNGNFNTDSGLNTVLAKQGHNIPVEKFFVPQGLVYLKHTNSENVFCQFSK